MAAAATSGAVVVHSELRRIGRFECSDDMLNQLHKNVVWGQRDERLGWTGDIAAFAPTAAYLYDVKGFLGEWLANVDVEQSHHDGVVPFVVPDILSIDTWRPGRPPQNSTCLWSDAGVWVPWALWQAYGDVADWMHKVIGGINPLEPGYSRVLISPKPGGGLIWASTILDTPHGTVAVSWRIDGDRATVDVTLPEGVTGVFRSPDGTEKELSVSSHLTLQIGA